MAQLKAGGVKALHEPISLPTPASGSRRSLSGSLQKQRKALAAGRRCSHVVCSEEALRSDVMGVQVVLWELRANPQPVPQHPLP